MQSNVRSCLCLLGVLWASTALAGLSGCAPPAKREELAKEVLRADPEFTQVLDKHRELANRIETHQRELALKRSEVERKIAQLRKDLTTAVVSVKQKTDDVKKRMEPDRVRLQLALSMASEQLQTTRLQRSSFGRSVSRLRNALKSTDSGWTAQERARREAQISDMLADAKRLDQEIASLKAHVRLLKIKLLLIKL